MTLKKIAEFYAGLCDDALGDIPCSDECADIIRTATLPSELVAEIERDRRDAGRYRFWRENGFAYFADTNPRGKWIVTDRTGKVLVRGYAQSLDTAIDAAIDAIAGKEAKP